MAVHRGGLLHACPLDHQAGLSAILPPSVSQEELSYRGLQHYGHQYFLHHNQLVTGILAVQAVGRHDPSGCSSKSPVPQPVRGHDGSDCPGKATHAPNCLLSSIFLAWLI